MNSSFNQGSIWRKWDLHIHSPLSYLNNQYPKINNTSEPDWEAFISKIEQTDLSVIGITDYFSIEGYKKIVEFKKQGRLPKVDCILPNIELRLHYLADKDRRINLHIIFSDDISPEIIENHFLHELHITEEGHPQDSDSEDKLKPENLERIGKRLKSENPNRFTNLNDLQAGATIITVSDKEITRILQTNRFKQKYIMILAEDGLPDWHSQAHGIRQTLTQKADMIFTSNQDNINWYLAKKGYVVDQFIKEFHSLKPCIHGSDSHDLLRIGRPCAKRGDKNHKCNENPDDCELRYCWIKADPTFEGLKQILYEPEDRVKIQQNNPTPMVYDYTIREFQLPKSQINDELSISHTILPLHYGLVAVTGGRGAGKTALVDLIANCFENRNNIDDNNSFVRRISQNDPDFITSVRFSNDKDFFKKVNDNDVFDRCRVRYFSQGELDKNANDANLAQAITKIIFGGSLESDGYLYSNLQKQIENHENDIRDISNQILELEEVTSIEAIQKFHNQKIDTQSEIAELERRINEAQRESTDTVILEGIQKDLSELGNRKDELFLLKEALSKGQKLLTNIDEFNKLNQTTNELLNNLGFNTNVTNIYYDISLITQLIDNVEGEITIAFSQIDTKKSELNQLEDAESELTKLLIELQEKSKNLQNIVNELEKIEQLKEQLIEKRKIRLQKYNSLLSSIIEIRKKYEDIIKHFSSEETSVILKDLSFSAEINFNRNDFLQALENLFHKGRVSIPDDFNDILSLYDEFTKDPEEYIQQLVNKVDEYANSEQFRNKIKNKRNNYYQVFFTNYFTVFPIVKYKHTRINRLSIGQKATVLLKIYLSQGNFPIIIDSHDDHLDNHFIMDELIPALREAKKSRQIILVSNNANVVVNADAEQIVIAERNDIEISFTSGSLENPEIRAKALQVLEGGEEAFRKRQEKYRLQK